MEIQPPIQLPYYAKISLLLVGLFVFVSILSIAENLILPVLYATIIAILIIPVVNYLVGKGMGRAFSIAGVLVFSLLIIFGFVALVVSQATLLKDALPQLIDKFQEVLHQAVRWASGYFNIHTSKINGWITDTRNELLNSSSLGIGNTLTTMGGMLATIFLTPVYIFMIVYYQPHLVKFMRKLFGAEHDDKVSEVLVETKVIIQNYLLGIFTEFVIIAVLNSLGLLLLGIDYAIILGIIGALLNVIPYLGGLIGVALFMSIALVTKTPVYVFYVAILYTVIQFIDNNFIVPKIVGSKVKLNALVSILAVIAGAALWGIPGMFLSIPVTAVLKLILDRIESLKPWGFLLGDTMPPIIAMEPPAKLVAKTKALVKRRSPSAK